MERNVLLFVVFFAIYALVCSAGPNPRHERFLATLNQNLNGNPEQNADLSLKDSNLGAPVTLWFKQRLDHFDAENPELFDQQYFVDSQHFKENGPVFIYIGGEGPQTPEHALGGEISEFGERAGALLVALEHRYYGKSQPFPELTFDNMQWLTVQQALADLAHFISTFDVDAYTPHKGDTHKWIVFGGSYAGACSSWLRLKYPHLISGSIASSGPVWAKNDFYEYDQTIAKVLKEYTADPMCYEHVKTVFEQVETELFASPAREIAVKSTLGMSAVENRTSCLYIIADAVSFAVQYNTEDNKLLPHLCEKVDVETGLMNSFGEFMNSSYTSTGTTAYDWDLLSLSNATDPEGPDAAGRSWFYQVCDLFGWFQVAPAENPLRSSKIDVDYHLKACKEVFRGDISPDTEWVNVIFGSQQPAGTKTFFTNGASDPWHVLSVLTPQKEILRDAHLISGGASHCSDLHASSPTDSEDMKQTRENQYSAIQSWISGNNCPSNCNGNGVCVFGKCSCDNDHYGNDCGDEVPASKSDLGWFITFNIIFVVVCGGILFVCYLLLFMVTGIIIGYQRLAYVSLKKEWNGMNAISDLPIDGDDDDDVKKSDAAADEYIGFDDDGAGAGDEVEEDEVAENDVGEGGETGSGSGGDVNIDNDHINPFANN